ncbi:MAG TPA: AMED_5909 family protein [Mycobacterium sp.]|nr:AMED_5909 family protein [Mycobacterium sp.]
MDETTKPVIPQTLVQAHEALARIRPARQAPLAEWLAYYQRSAALYAEVAEIDRGHHHESLYWANHERARAKEIKAQINTSDER